MSRKGYLQKNESIDVTGSLMMKSIEVENENRIEISYATNPRGFKKRICCYAVEDKNNNNLCVGCKESIQHGEHQFLAQKWDPQTCTRTEETDAYGKIRFGEYGKIAQYIRVDHKTLINDMIQFLYSESGFKISKPQLIISVTGGAKNFAIPRSMKNAFKLGLIKAATSTNALIITGGTNKGVMKLVGEAVSESLVDLSKVSVLGIATWGKIANRDILVHGEDEREKYRGEMTREVQYCKDDVYQVDDKDVALDPNHTHFLLVDDGSIGKYGVEINFRSALENELCEGRPLGYYNSNKNEHDNQDTTINPNDLIEKIPMILIVVQGGPNTLKTIAESINKNIPVLVLAESQGCADLIANFCLLKDKRDDNKLISLIFKFILQNLIRINDETLDDLKEINRILENNPGVLNDKKFIDAFNDLKEIRRIWMKNPELLNVFQLDSDENSHDIELAILRVFLNSKEKDFYYKNLKLAIKWNQIDIAKTHIFTGVEEFSKEQIFDLMELAIIENKPDFVELLVESKVDLASFLNERRLLFLYNSNKVQKDAKKAPIYQLLKSQYNLIGDRKLIITYKLIEKFCYNIGLEYVDLNFMPRVKNANKSNDIRLERENLIDFLTLSNKYGQTKVLENHPKLLDFGKDKVKNASQNLFFWALLHNRIELAIIFWRIGRYHIINGLFASALLKKMAIHVSDIRNELLESADYFENLSLGVLNIFDINTDDRINIDILLNPIWIFKTSTLQMAQIGDCKQFVAHSAVQNLLTSIWFGQISYKIGIKQNLKFLLSCFTFGLTAPLFMVDEDEWIFKMTELNRSKWKEAKKDRNFCYLIRNAPLKLLDNERNSQHPWALEKTPTWNCCSSKSSEYVYHDSAILYRVDSTTPPENNDKMSKVNVVKKYFSRLHRFTQIPRVLFFYDVVSYMIFLLLFSYMMLCNFNFKEEILVLNSNLTDNQTQFNENKSLIDSDSVEFKKIITSKPSWLNYLLSFWVFTFFCEEIRQFFNGNSTTKNFYLKVKSYLNDSWNYLDISGCLIFSIGMSLRFVAYFKNSEDLFIAARIILCINLFIWFIRILHVTLVFKSLGPKLVMIKKMVKDLVFFISIIAVFVFSFGITTQATLYPNSSLNMQLIKSMINKAYWPIYGEMKIFDEDLEKDNCTNDGNGDDCPEESGIVFSYIALMIYMVIANVLLINLLIAMFSSTFQHVEENTDKIWKFQRYRLIFEYKNLLILPPPLIFITHIYEFIKFCHNKRIENKKNDEDNKNDNDDDVSMNNNDIKKHEDENETLLYNNEKKYAEIHLRKEKAKDREQIESRLKINSEKLEKLELKLNEVVQLREKENEKLYAAVNWIMGKIRGRNEDIPQLTSISLRS